MLSNAAFCAPARTTLRETESGAHYDTEEGPRSIRTCEAVQWRANPLAFAVARAEAPRFGEHDADAAFYRNPDGTAAATR